MVNNQFQVSLFSESEVVETATGGMDPHLSAASWRRAPATLGQVATPQAVAQLMAGWVTSANPRTILDPAAGLGSLLHECRRLNSRTKLVGVERDEKTFHGAKEAAPQGTRLILADYLLSNFGQFDGIIANPPYVKAHRLDYSESHWRGFEESLGTRLDRLTNLYALFLLKIWEDLAPNGRAAVLLPAEFLNANFGEEIKDRLMRVMCPPGLIVFTPSLNLFSDALTTSALIFLQKGRSASAPAYAIKAESLAEAETFQRQLLASPASVMPAGYRNLRELDPHAKWLNLILNAASNGKPLFPGRIGDYFDCRRGIATGANDYFTLTTSELRAHNLTLDHVERCITKAADANGLLFTPGKFSKLIALDRKCYLLNPRKNEDAAVAKYLQKGQKRGIPKRFLPSHRPVWYLPENRDVADIWVAVFSRESGKFLLNTSKAKNLTCFHGLYAKPACKNLAPLLTLYLHSSWGRLAFCEVNRFYGDGLNKLEPKDVEDLPCPRLPELSRSEAETLVARLAELELLNDEQRKPEIDSLVSARTDVLNAAKA